MLVPFKAVLWGKLNGAQCSETVKSRVPSLWFVWKIWDFLVARGQKLGARGHRALLEHSPAIAPGVPWGCLTLLQNLATLQVKALCNPFKMRGWRSRVCLIDMTLKDETLKGQKGTHGYLCQGENPTHYSFIIHSLSIQMLSKNHSKCLTACWRGWIFVHNIFGKP